MKITVATIAIAVLSLTAQAQQSKVLTLESAVEIARQKNVSVIQARNTVEGQQTAVRAAYGGFLPTITANGGYSTGTSWNSPFPATTSQDFNAGISGRLTLFNGFANTSNVKRAQATSDATEYTLNRTEQSTIYQTHQLYLNVVRTYQLMKVSEDNLKRSKRQLERITESNKVGAVALADVYRQQVQAGSDELALIQAQNNHEKSKQDLMAFLGVDFDAEYTFNFNGIPSDIDTSEFSSVNSQYNNFQNLLNTAIEKRPDYQASIQNLSSSDASLSMARAGHFPTISASGSYGYRGTNGDIGYSPLSDNRSLSLSLDVTLPIFSGFSTQNQVEQASVQQKNSEEQLRQSQRQITVDIRKALLDLESAEKQLSVTKSSVESAEMDRKIAEEKYNLGAGTLLDLLIANANYTSALSNKVNAVINYLLAKKNTEFALGTINK
jgi:outer membrane protein